VRGGTNWGIVAHTVAMFSFLTIPIALDLNIISLGYIDGREFPGGNGFLPGPLGYQSVRFSSYPSATFVVIALMFPLNQWLADGLLLYRCYVIYSMDKRIIAIPCVAYLTTVGLGILFVYNAVQPLKFAAVNISIGLVYFAVCLSLNALLTLMIVARLLIHQRNIRKAVRASAGFSGLYTAVVTMLVESAALYAFTFLLYIGSWASDSAVVYIFSPIISQIEVIAPFLITLRVAERRALTSEMVTSGNIGSIHFTSQGSSTGDGETPSEGNYMSLTAASGEVPDDPSVRAEDIVEEVPS